MSPIITTISNSGARGKVRPPGAAPVAAPFFSDDFAGPARNNANGFTWNSTGARVAPVVFDGFNCLRFRFGPDAIGEDSSAEQRFEMGRNLSELWVEYDLHIPSNFALRADFPANNKFLALWTDTYDAAGRITVVLEYERNGTDSSRSRSIANGSESQAAGMLSNAGDRTYTESFITAAKAGAWYRIRVHFRMASASGQTNGVFEVMMGNELVWRSRSDYVWYPVNGSSVAYIRNGYLMGWANSGFTDETDFHLRDIKFYDSDPQWGMV